MAVITALPVNSIPPNDWWRRVSTAFNLMLGEVADLYRRPISAVTANYTATDADYAIIADATAGAITVTLPPPTKGRELYAKKVDSSANAVTLNGQIEGATSKVLSTQWAGVRLFGNGDRWLIE